MINDFCLSPRVFCHIRGAFEDQRTGLPPNSSPCENQQQNFWDDMVATPQIIINIYIYMIEKPLGSISSLKSARLELDI